MASKKASSKLKLSNSVKVSEDEGLEQRKDYAMIRWDVLEEGCLAIYQPQANAPTERIPLTGLIKRAVYDARASIIPEDEEGKKSKRQTVRFLYCRSERVKIYSRIEKDLFVVGKYL